MQGHVYSTKFYIHLIRLANCLIHTVIVIIIIIKLIENFHRTVFHV
jgi:hypothetical protein